MRFWLWLTVTYTIESTSPSRGARGSCRHPPQRVSIQALHDKMTHKEVVSPYHGTNEVLSPGPSQCSYIYLS